jgi:iron complex transport system substrate-binding protein
MKRGIFFLLFCILPFLSYGRELVDIYGRRVRVPDRVERVVAVGPGALRMVVYLSGTEKVVGVERVEKGGFTPYGRPYTLAIEKRIGHLPIIGEGGPGKLPDFEAIVSVRPDVILACAMNPDTVELIEEKTRTKTVALDYGALGVLRSKRFMDSLSIVAQILGKEERLQTIVRYIEETERTLNESTKDAKERPRAYVGGLGFKGQHGITSTEAGFLPLKLINGENVVDRIGKEGHLFIDKETLLSLDPDVIFLDVNGLSLFEVDLKENPSFYRRLKAVKGGKVFTILPYNYYNTNVEVALADAFFMGKVLYPERFQRLDVERKTDELVRFFVSEPVYKIMKEKFGRFGKIRAEEKGVSILDVW